MATFRTKGSCSREIIFTVDENDTLTSVKFLGGCSGNLQAISRLVVGKKISDIVNTLKGIQCKNGTSCPDQLTQALLDYEKRKTAAALGLKY